MAQHFHLGIIKSKQRSSNSALSNRFQPPAHFYHPRLLGCVVLWISVHVIHRKRLEGVIQRIAQLDARRSCRFAAAALSIGRNRRFDEPLLLQIPMLRSRAAA
jgi:hypothetical protein